MQVAYLVAMDRNGVIGFNGKLPWHLPAELAYFKRTTMGHAMIMGRRTYESIGRALPGRRSIVLTRDRTFQAEGCAVVHTKAAALQAALQEAVAFVIGGAELFQLFLPEAELLYMTVIDHEFPGDTYFPDLKWAEWALVHEGAGIVDAENPYPTSYRIYERKRTKEEGHA